MRGAHLTALAAAVVALGAAPAADPPLRVRADAAARPCVEAVGRAWARTGRPALRVEGGLLRGPGAWDVLVGSSVELTRALEGGDAVVNSDVAVASVPWVLAVGPAGPAEVRGLDDARRAGLELAMLGGPAAYEARRAVVGLEAARLVETTDTERLRAAPLALVPLSLAGPGRRLAVDVPPIRVVAAVGARTTRAEAAREIVRFLASASGQAAFAACAPAP